MSVVLIFCNFFLFFGVCFPQYIWKNFSIITWRCIFWVQMLQLMDDWKLDEHFLMKLVQFMSSYWNADTVVELFNQKYKSINVIFESRMNTMLFRFKVAIYLWWNINIMNSVAVCMEHIYTYCNHINNTT